MEIAALSGLIAIGVAVSQLASTTPNRNTAVGGSPQREGFRSLNVGILPQNLPPSDPALPVPSQYYTIGVQKYLTKDESEKITDLNNRINAMGSTAPPQATQSMKAQIQTVLQRAAERASATRGPDSMRAAANTAMSGTELDFMYRTPGGQMYPSEPNGGPKYGSPLSYGT